MREKSCVALPLAHFIPLALPSSHYMLLGRKLQAVNEANCPGSGEEIKRAFIFKGLPIATS